MIGKELFMIGGKTGFSTRISRESHDCPITMIRNFGNLISSPHILSRRCSKTWELIFLIQLLMVTMHVYLHMDKLGLVNPTV
jgi:hypothetical protein